MGSGFLQMFVKFRNLHGTSNYVLYCIRMNMSISRIRILVVYFWTYICYIYRVSQYIWNLWDLKKKSLDRRSRVRVNLLDWLHFQSITVNNFTSSSILGGMKLREENMNITFCIIFSVHGWQSYAFFSFFQMFVFTFRKRGANINFESGMIFSKWISKNLWASSIWRRETFGLLRGSVN